MIALSVSGTTRLFPNVGFWRARHIPFSYQYLLFLWATGRIVSAVGQIR